MTQATRIFIIMWYIGTLVLIGVAAGQEEQRVEGYPDNQLIFDVEGALK